MGDWIVTTGAEFRMSLTLENTPLFIFSYGYAQSPSEWAEDFNGAKPYFQMTLINPF
ncbi:uncharacterized protein METZ01_LOCUS336680 [marine metagenome]|uniref:Uncharacterized protein n=1 Tax=marine metagenome TaxID=408172 RepID=A0A382QEG0_9ZZZZ